MSRTTKIKSDSDNKSDSKSLTNYHGDEFGNGSAYSSKETAASDDDLDKKETSLIMVLKQKTLHNRDMVLYMFSFLSVIEIYGCFEVSKSFAVLARSITVKKLVRS